MIDADFFRLRIGAMIARGFLVDAVRGGLNLGGASEVWGGPSFDDRPAWYFWLTTAPGAYRLRLENVEPVAGTAAAARGLLSVNYYPSPSEPVFERYGAEERALVRDGFFDDTNTPVFEVQDRIAETLFAVGGIEFLHDPACGQSLLSFSACDRLHLDAPPCGPTPIDASDADAANGDRAGPDGLPAWDLGYPLFEAVVGLEAFLTRRGPARVILSHRHEAEGRSGGDRGDCASAFRTQLAVFAPDGAAGCAAEAAMIAALCRAPWQVVYDCAVPAAEPCRHAAPAQSCACGHAHRHEGPHAPMRPVRLGDVTVEVPLAVTDQWWVLAEAEPSAGAMPCGCH